MAHHDDSFWLAIFKKSPIIASSMAIGGVIGCAGAGIYFSELLPFLRAYLCTLISCTLGGLFVGLVVGVVIDSLLNAKREKDRKGKQK